MREWFAGGLSHELVRNAIASLLLVAGLLLIRFLLQRAIHRAEILSPELRRRWLVQIRNATVLAVILGLTIIWATELRTLALSLVALGVALVLATKELILCVSGSLLKVGARSFSVGDRIEVKGLRGDVIDQTLLTTTIMEVGPGRLPQQRTGRLIVLPNSIFLTEPLINDNLGQTFSLHTVVVPLRTTDDWAAAEQALLGAATEECRSFLEDARRQMASLAQHRALDTPGVDPRVTVHLPAPGQLDLVVRFPVPTQHRTRVEQAVLRRYLGRVTEKAGAVAAAEPARGVGA
jgi:small-conductance mechanosensitive channel